MVYDLEPGQPVIGIGPQRCGKSNLFAWLLEELSSVVIFDSSHHPLEWAAWGPPHGYVVTDDPADILQHALVVYQVPMQVLLDVSGWRQPGALGFAWTTALMNVMKRGNTATLFDELVHQLPAGRPHPAAMQIYTQGAKFGITPFGGSQFANLVQTSTIRAAVHAFAFAMNPVDLALLAERRGVDTRALATLPKYGFGYHLTATPAWHISAPCPRVMG